MTGNRQHSIGPSEAIDSRFSRTVVSVLSAVVIGWILCECLLRVLVPKPIFYSTWFTDGVHKRDAEFGFVFRPHYRGAMRNVDHVWMEPISLDASGFRHSAVRNDRSDLDPSRIVMLGGASMAFCYGLADTECLHHQVADRLDGNCRVDLISWPGFTLGQDIKKLQRFTDPGKFDVAVILAFGEDDYRFHPDWDQLDPVVNVQMIDSVVTADDPVVRLGGALYHESYVVAGLCRAAQVPTYILSRSSVADYKKKSAPPATPHEPPGGQTQVYLAAQRLVDLGIESVLIVALPHQGRHVGPSVLPAPTSDDIQVVDLRSEIDRQPFDWIAYGHYGPESADRLAVKIAAAIERADWRAEGDEPRSLDSTNSDGLEKSAMPLWPK